MAMLAYVFVQFNFLKASAKFSIIPARQNQFIQENNFNIVPRIAIAINASSALKGSYTECFYSAVNNLIAENLKHSEVV